MPTYAAGTANPVRGAQVDRAARSPRKALKEETWPRSRQIRPHPRHVNHLLTWLLLGILFVSSGVAAAVRIDFDDLPAGTPIHKDYLAGYGVHFNSGRICQPSKGTASGKQALTHATSLMEFSPDPLIIWFNGPQSLVRLSAGVNHAPPQAINATMTAFDAQGKKLGSVSKKLGPGASAVTKVLEIKLGQKKIREVRLHYDSVHFEVIDDLEFDDPKLPPPDANPPVVTISKPQSNQTFHSALFELLGNIKEAEGLKTVSVTIKPKTLAASVIADFDYDDTATPITFHAPAMGNLSPGENVVTVTATDIGNNQGSDSITIYYYPPATGLRKLGVYSLSEYEPWPKYGGGWKGPVKPDPEYDPYTDTYTYSCNDGICVAFGFWGTMTHGAGAYSVDKAGSQRFLNQEVTIKSLIPIPGDKVKSWEDFDLVFFYGHNNTIVPPQKDDDFECAVFKQGAWDYNQPNCYDWGTLKSPFDLYAFRPITNAFIYPGAVIYLYNQFTAALLGDPYDYGGGEPEGATQYYREKWSNQAKVISYGKLGSQNLKWLVLHGCQAVITAFENGQYLNLALKALGEIHGGYHIILGHYHSFYTSDFHEVLNSFAIDLISGVPIQTAYFDQDPDTNSSAIAAEATPFDWATSVMTNDTWLSPMTVPATSGTFSQRWIVPQGFTQQKP
jgi:hypothetical protein